MLYRQIRVKDLPKVPMWRLDGVRMQGTELTTEPPRGHTPIESDPTEAGKSLQSVPFFLKERFGQTT